MDFGPLLLNNFLPNLAFHLPLLIVLLVGFVMAIIRWKKNPRTSLLTAIATAISGVVMFLGVVSNSFLYYFGYEVLNMDFVTVNIIFKVLTVVFNLLTSVSWVLVLIAIFFKKKPKAETE